MKDLIITMRILLIIIMGMIVSCDQQIKKMNIKSYPSDDKFIKYDTVSYGDDRFHDDKDLGYQVFGYTETDTLRVAWIPRTRWQDKP